MDLTNQISVRSLILTAIFAVCAYTFHSLDASAAVLAGGLIVFANFRLSSKNLNAIMNPGINPAIGKGLALVSYIVRFALLGTAIYMVITSGIDPVFFILGLSSVVGAIFISFRELRSAV